MTDREFWVQLDKIADKPFSSEREMEFMEELASGYSFNRKIMAGVVFHDESNRKNVHMSYQDVGGYRFYNCFTARKYSDWFYRRFGGEWAVLSLRDVLRNIFTRDSAGGIIFNPFADGSDPEGKHTVFVMKPLIRVILSEKASEMVDGTLSDVGGDSDMTADEIKRQMRKIYDAFLRDV